MIKTIFTLCLSLPLKMQKMGRFYYFIFVLLFYYFIISKTFKRLLRTTLKTYERTGTYVFLKVFKKTTEEYEFKQRFSLTLQEFGSLVNTPEKLLESIVHEKSAKNCSTNSPTNKRLELQHESVSKDDGSYV